VQGLRDGNWVLIYNDTERGRHSLAVSLSEDEGKTWKFTRHLEKSAANDPNGTNGHYPSIIQAADGTLLASYTYSLKGNKVKPTSKGTSCTNASSTLTSTKTGSSKGIRRSEMRDSWWDGFFNPSG